MCKNKVVITSKDIKELKKFQFLKTHLTKFKFEMLFILLSNWSNLQKYFFIYKT